MKNHYHYIDNKRVIHVQSNLVQGVGGVDKYRRWKGIKCRMFHVEDAMTAIDLLVHIQSEVDIFEVNKGFCDHMVKYYGVDDDYLLVYCLQRGVDIEIRGGYYVAHLKPLVKSSVDNSLVGVWDHCITGHGPSLVMALSNLHYELSTALNKTFIP